MTQTEKDSNTLQDMFKPRRNPERINWDRSRDLAGEQSILWACAGCTGRPSYWGSDEETVWQSCQRCGHEKVTHLDTLMQDLTALKNDRCPKCYARDKHPQSLVWRLERCAKCVRWPFKREFDSDKPQFDRNLADWKCRREYVYERDHYTCQYCGKVTNSPHCDHVIPKSRGADKLQFHEREVMHSLDAITGGLEVIAGLVQCLEGEMLKAEKLAATLNDARARKRHWQGAAYNTKVGRRER